MDQVAATVSVKEETLWSRENLKETISALLALATAAASDCFNAGLNRSQPSEWNPGGSYCVFLFRIGKLLTLGFWCWSGYEKWQWMCCFWRFLFLNNAGLQRMASLAAKQEECCHCQGSELYLTPTFQCHRYTIHCVAYCPLTPLKAIQYRKACSHFTL